MRKWIILSCLLVAAKAHAFKPPQDVDGGNPFSVQDYGVETLLVGHNTTSAAVYGSSIAIDGYLLSTASFAGSQSQFLIIKSTALENGAGNVAVPNNTEHLVPELVFTTTTRNTFGVFDPPIIAIGGFTAEVTSRAVCAAVFYHSLDTATINVSTELAGRYRIPRNARDGSRAYSVSLFGVKAASEVTPGAARSDGKGTEALDLTSTEKVIAGSTETFNYTVEGTTTVADSGRRSGFLYGWIASTGALGNYIIFRDTNSVGSSGESHWMMPPIFYNSLDDDDDAAIGKKNSIFRFPWPIRYYLGLTQQRSAAGDRIRILHRPALSTY